MNGSSANASKCAVVTVVGNGGGGAFRRSTDDDLNRWHAGVGGLDGLAVDELTRTLSVLDADDGVGLAEPALHGQAHWDPRLQILHFLDLHAHPLELLLDADDALRCLAGMTRTGPS